MNEVVHLGGETAFRIQLAKLHKEVFDENFSVCEGALSCYWRKHVVYNRQ